MTFNHPDVGSNPANPNYVTVTGTLSDLWLPSDPLLHPSYPP